MDGFQASNLNSMRMNKAQAQAKDVVRGWKAMKLHIGLSIGVCVFRIHVIVCMCVLTAHHTGNSIGIIAIFS